MEKVFNVNIYEKNRLHKCYIKSKKWPKIISHSILALIVIFTICFLIYAFGYKDSFLIWNTYDTDYGKKDLILIWGLLIGGDFILAFLWLVQYLVIQVRILGKEIRMKVNESLLVVDSVFEYGYQNAFEATAGDRVVVRIPIEKIEKIKINKDIRRVEFFCSYNSMYYENYKRGITRANPNKFHEGSYVLFDYYEPGLIYFLEINMPEKIEE